MGFESFTMTRYAGDPKNIILWVVLTNAPQLLLSIFYFLCNGLLTCMLVAAEWNQYGTQRKFLRVSWPKGQQRTTKFLSLPWKYAGPMLALSATLHWLLAETFFFTNVQYMDYNHEVDDDSSFYGAKWSFLPMFILILLMTVSILLLCVLGAFPLRSHMPLATHCSAAISAACHAPADGRDAALKPVMWGELPDEDDGDTDGRDEGSITLWRAPFAVLPLKQN